MFSLEGKTVVVTGGGRISTGLLTYPHHQNKDIDV